MRYRIAWVDRIEYACFVEADSIEAAREAFDDGDIDCAEPQGFCETEQDSIEVKEAPKDPNTLEELRT